MSESEHYHFATGRLAEVAVRGVVAELAERIGFRYTIDVLPITVAALMTGRWLLRHWNVPPEATQVILPGYLSREIEVIQGQTSVPVACGPKNIQDLANFFGKDSVRPQDYGSFDIEIIAEINHADRLTVEQIIQQAELLSRDGADVIDLGCSPDHRWPEVGIATRELKGKGLRVSIDSFDAQEVSEACAAGAELVLSVNSANCHLADQWGCEVVAIPDSPRDLSSLDRTAQQLQKAGVRFRLDPILEPIGLGLAASLQRYASCRRDFPGVPIMMGIGNITELTDADSAGVNIVLLGLCQELEIRSVLTTQVINWARTSVRECDLARRLVYFAARHSLPPKHLEPQLVLLRDEKLNELSEEVLGQIAGALRDPNFRLFTSGGKIHAMTAGLYICGEDPFEVMQQILDSPAGDKLDASHAYYLGFEMCKALQALTLSKAYEQDEALQWGYLTRSEKHQRLKPRPRRSVE